MAQESPPPVKPPHLVGLLAWLLPGAGHWYLGLKVRGAILFVAIGAMFWGGVAVGGIRSTVDPDVNTHWFMGQIGAGGHTMAALAISRTIRWSGDDGRGWGKSRDIGVVYAGVAGLLNLLAVFDAIVRCISGQVRELPPSEDEEEKAAPARGPD